MRKKRILTRRQRAIRKLSLPAALLFLSVLALLLHRGYTPAAARRDSEDRSGMGPTHVVEEIDVSLGDSLTVRAVLSENRRGLLFSVAHYDWLNGWQAVNEYAVDQSRRDLGRDPSLYGGVVNVCHSANREKNAVFLFFHVDRSICRVEMAGDMFCGSDWERTPVQVTWERQGEETTVLLFPDWDVGMVGNLNCVGYDARGSEVVRNVSFSGPDIVINRDGTSYGGFVK